MKLIVRLLAAALAAGSVNCQTTKSSVELMTTVFPTETISSMSGSQSDCPTVTLTSNICETCATPDCVQIKPITQSCGCPSAVPTVFVDYPCESGCGGVGCAADYVFFTANCTVAASSLSSDLSTAATALWTGTGLNGTNTTTSRTTIMGTSTSSMSAAPSIAAARMMRPFWAVWL